MKWMGLVLMLGASGSWTPAHSSQTKDAAANAASAAHAACMKACQREYERSMAQCKPLCFICDFSVLGICIEGHHDRECLRGCRVIAESTYVACAGGC